jgi:hypothetical protein
VLDVRKKGSRNLLGTYARSSSSVFFVQAGTPIFPYDYPDCPAYSRALQAAHKKALDEYAKTPRSKRPREPPCLPDWNLLCGSGADAAPRDDPMGDATLEATAVRPYFVARDKGILGKAAGSLPAEKANLEPSKTRKESGPSNVKQGLRSGRLVWVAVGSGPVAGPAVGGVPRGLAGTSCGLVETLLKMPRKGVPEEGAQILMPKDEDFEAWCKSRTWQGVALLAQERGGKGEGHGRGSNEGDALEKRQVMGYVTSPSPPSGSAQNRAFALCRASAVSRLRARQYSEKAGSGGGPVFVLIHNVGSNMGRPGLLDLRLEHT